MRKMSYPTREFGKALKSEVPSRRIWEWDPELCWALEEGSNFLSSLLKNFWAWERICEPVRVLTIDYIRFQFLPNIFSPALAASCTL